jgi:hydrogenase maturation factor
VEGTSIIARERRADLLAMGWSATDIDTAAAYLHTPGISIYRPAHAAAEAALVTALHDPTEGGVATGLAEMAAASNVGMQVDLDAIPISPLSARLCADMGVDPLGTIASGALLAACAPGHVDALLALWRELGWAATVVGRVEEARHGLQASRSGRPAPFPVFAADELTRLWNA